MSELVTHELLKGFLEAFNRHDLDAIMGYFAEDCVFYMPRGAAPRGDRYVGKDEVRVRVPALAGWRPRTVGRRFARAYGRQLVVTAG